VRSSGRVVGVPRRKGRSGRIARRGFNKRIAGRVGYFYWPHQRAVRDKQVLLDVHMVWDYSGEARALENQPMAWVTPRALTQYAFPAANVAIVTALGKLFAG
jgi:hypothetical protein